MKLSNLLLFLLITLSPLIGATNLETSQTSQDCEWTLMGLQDSSVELELRISAKASPELPANDAKNILSILTTPNGLVSGLIEHLLHEAYQKEFPDISLNTKWSEVGWKQQFDILKWLGKNRDWKPENDKPLHSGLLLDTSIPEFQDYAKDPSVHMGDPNRKEFFDLLEIHFRTNKYSPSQLPEKSFDLMKARGISKRNGHEHVVGTPPKERFEKAEDLLAFLINYRNVNLASEMISIVNKGLSLKFRRFEFGTLTGEKLKDLTTAFIQWRNYETFKFRAFFFKFHYVAFRFPDFYDGKQPTFGWEFRTLSDHVLTFFAPILDYAQEYLNLKAEPESDTLDWLRLVQVPESLLGKLLGRNKEADFMERLYYRQSDRDINFKLAPPAIQELAKKSDTTALIKESAENLEVQMLFYDWTQDPLLFAQSEELKNKLLVSQMNAFRYSLKNPANASNHVRIFLEESGLYNLVIKSVSPKKKALNSNQDSTGTK